MACPRCRQDTPSGATLCPKCGASLGPSARRQGPAGNGPDLHAIAKTATRLCDAHDAQIFLADGATLRLVAQYGSLRTTRHLEEPFPLSRSDIHGRAVLERRVIHVRDMKAAVRTQYPELNARQRATGIRTMLAAPLLSEGAAIGAIVIRRLRVRPFTSKQIALLEAFAEHAATAIEKTRLAQVLTVALDRQTATSEILRVIGSSPTDAQPVFDAIARSAVRLLGGSSGAVLRLVGANLHLAAITSTSAVGNEAIRRRFPQALADTTLSAQVVRERAPSFVSDTEVDPQIPGEMRRVARARGYRSMLQVPMLREGAPIGVISVARPEPGPFAADEMTLLQTFADQAVIAIENVRLFKELEARNRDLTEALEQQTATAEILRAISSSPTDIRPVLETLVHAAARFCGAPNVALVTLDGEVLRGAAAAGPFGEELIRSFGRIEAFEVPVSKGSVTGRAVSERRTVHIHDLAAVPVSEFPVGRELQRRLGHRSIVATPLLREGTPIGAIDLFRTEVNPFTDKQLSLLQTFADQAVIAIENVRLFKELEARNRDLTEALEQQTATSEILRAIAGSPTDLQPVLDAVAQNAARVCGAFDAVLVLGDGDTGRIVAHCGPLEATLGYKFPLTRGSVMGRAIIDRQTVHVHDLAEADEAEFPEGRALARRLGHRTTLGTPLLRQDVAVGSLLIRRTEVRPFTDKQIELLKTFADQAVIAIENVRLFKELEARNHDLSVALDRQTATSEILRVIGSSPTDAEPVFDAIVRSAVRLLGGFSGAVLRLVGDDLHLAAITSTSDLGDEAIRKRFPLPLAYTPIQAQAVRQRAPSVVSDMEVDPRVEGEMREVARARGYRSMLQVPMLREDTPIGVISVTRREPGPFADEEIALLQTFADQAVIAIENVRLFKELEARNRDLTEALEQQTATGEVLRVIASSPTELAPVLETVVANAVKLAGANQGHIRQYDGELLKIVADFGESTDEVALLKSIPVPPSGESASGRAFLECRPIHLVDAQQESWYRGPALKGGGRTVLVVPLLREGAPIGTISIWRYRVEPFTEKQIELVTRFADQAVIAIENVRLFQELQARTGELARSVEELRALGEVGRAVSSTLDLETVLTTIVSRAVDLSETTGGIIYEFDERSEELQLRASHQVETELVEALRGAPIRLGEGATGRAAALRTPVQVMDLLTEREFAVTQISPIAEALGYRSILAVPLLLEDRIMGGLTVWRKQPGGFAPEAVNLLQTFAAQSSLAIQNARLFRELEEKGHLLEVASRHKSQFLANMSHELRTPLNAILGYTELLLDGIYGQIPDRGRETMERIDRSGRHLLSLINDVLDLSKIEAGQLTLSLGDYSLKEVVQTVVTAMEPLAAEKKLALTVTVAPDLPVGRGDDRRLSQVLLNLVGNAVKFTDAGAVRVEAKASDGAFLVSVSDTGPGIAAEDQARIFEEFQQADTSSTRKKGGTGLGLSIARRIIELHGGGIRVESAPGKGSTFSFTVPVRVERMAEAP